MKYVALLIGLLSFNMCAMDKEFLRIENQSSEFVIVHYTRIQWPIENASILPHSIVTISIKKPSETASQQLIFSWIGGRKKISIITTKDPVILQPQSASGQIKAPLSTGSRK